MVIGLVGADNRAVTIARQLRRCGHTVSFSDPNGLDHAEKAVAALADPGVSAATPNDQAATSDMLILLVHWEDMGRTLTQLGDYKEGIVVDTMRPPRIPGAENTAKLLQEKLGNRHVVKAFVEEPLPKAEVMVAADDPKARSIVLELVAACGGTPVDLGPLSEASRIERLFHDETKAIRGTV